MRSAATAVDTEAAGKGWNTLFRLYSPLPSFFSKGWKPGEIELVK